VSLRVQTHREIEIKLRIIDLSQIIARLKSLGATSPGRVFEQNTLFDAPDSHLRNSGRLLRVRIESSAPKHGLTGGPTRTILTSKAPVPANGPARMQRFKEKLERELISNSKRDWVAVLRPLGFLPGFRYEKYRTSFHLPGLHMDLDETPVGIFLELEGEAAKIDQVARKFGFSERDYLSATYWDLYADDCRRRGHSITNMLFDE
jgi:adenylate cyclase class 2